MNRLRFVVNTVAVLTLLICCSALAQAQATRTWVSGVGDDANPCSRTAPCKTFAGAISKTAASGEINVLDPGGFGGVTITKAITIDGSPFLAGVLTSGTTAIIVNAGATDVVTLRGLDIHGFNSAPSGVRFLAGKELQVQNCVIYGFTRGIDISHTNSASFTSISDTIIRNNTSAGILVNGGPGFIASVSVVNSQLISNSVGLDAANFSSVTANGTVATNNSFAGFRVLGNAGSTADLTLMNCQASLNARGVLAQNAGSAPTVRLDNVNVTSNTTTGLELSGTATIATFGNNKVANNGLGSSAPNLSITPQ
jgi:Right handed beta helix region